MAYFSLLMLIAASIHAIDTHESFSGVTAWAEETISYNTGSRIRFTGILLNEGNHYSPDTGYFTCPVDGVYMVSVTTVRNNDASMLVNVQKETEVMLTLKGALNNQYLTYSNTVISLCSAGNHIYLEGAGLGAIFGNPLVPMSVFTVVLLNETEVLQKKHDTLIALSVSKTDEATYGAGEPIIYEKQLFSSGAFYLQPVNRFICTVSGVYFVNVGSRKSGTNPYHAVLKKNDETVLDCEDINLSNNNVYVTNNGLVECHENDTLTVQAASDCHIDGEDDPASIFSIFMTNSLNEEILAAFTAFKRSSQNYTTGSVIQFDGIVYNGGAHYDPITSQFVCPVTGVYYVTLNAKRNADAMINVYVEKQREKVFQLENEGENNDDATLSNSALVKASAGDTIQVIAGGRGSIYGNNLSAATTFTAFLIYQDA